MAEDVATPKPQGGYLGFLRNLCVCCAGRPPSEKGEARDLRFPPKITIDKARSPPAKQVDILLHFPCLAETPQSSEVCPKERAPCASTVPLARWQQNGPQPPPYRWQAGDPVERLLDDISDIWAGATVVSCSKDGLFYDVAFADDGKLERRVEGIELRPRKKCFDMPLEFWIATGSCLRDKQDLCNLEMLSRAPAEASRRESQAWWCCAYHHRFGRCGPRCRFEKLIGREGAAEATKMVARCSAASSEGITAADRMPWKKRYIEQEKLSDPDRVDKDDSRAPGDAAYTTYSATGKKLNQNRSSEGWYFDPRLGRMVKADGSPC